VAAVDFPEDDGTINFSTAISTIRALHMYTCFHFFLFFLLQVAAVDFPEDVGTIDLSAGAEKVNTMKWSNYVRGVCRELQEVCVCVCDCVCV